MADTQRFQNPSNTGEYRLDDTGVNKIEQGDIVRWNAGSRFIQVLATGANGPNLTGVAEVHGPTPKSLIDNVENLVTSGLVRHDGIFSFKTTASDSLEHGDALVIGADPQTVLKQTGEANTEIIAHVWRPDATAALTGAAGVEVDVILKAAFPDRAFF